MSCLLCRTSGRRVSFSLGHHTQRHDRIVLSNDVWLAIITGSGSNVHAGWPTQSPTWDPAQGMSNSVTQVAH